MIRWSNVRHASAFQVISPLIRDNHSIDTQLYEWCLLHVLAKALEIDFYYECISISVMEYARAST